MKDSRALASALSRSLLIPLSLGSGAFLPLQAAPQVKLLIPVRDGLEFAQVSRMVAEARVFEEADQVFVMVGAFADARVAYRLGATLQQRLKLPFELHYDPGHPQSDLSWLKVPQPSPSTAAPASPEPQQAADSSPSKQDSAASSPSKGDSEVPRSRRVDPPAQESALAAAPACASSGPEGAADQAAGLVPCPPDGGPPLGATPVAAESAPRP